MEQKTSHAVALEGEQLIQLVLACHRLMRVSEARKAGEVQGERKNEDPEELECNLMLQERSLDMNVSVMEDGRPIDEGCEEAEEYSDSTEDDDWIHRGAIVSVRSVWKEFVARTRIGS